ncbi:MAG: glycosyltransferase [Coriobacteriia bacterium]|nr:glycosyltransferase [Coriobacteriia bacterium]
MRVGFTGNAESPIFRVWVDEMRKRGIDAVAIGPEYPSWDVEWAEIALRPPRIRGVGLGRRDIARQLASICRDGRIDVLHSHEARRHAFWARSSSFRPRVVSCWGSDVLRLHQTPLGHRLGVRMALHSADAVLVGSKVLLRAAVAAGARKSRCHLVGWGVDLEIYQRRPDARARIRAEWGFEDRVVVVSTRQHRPLYRIPLIIEGFAEALRQKPNLALVISGEGPETPRLRVLAESLQLGESVRFIGAVPHDGWPSMADVLSGGDLYCSVPETDGGPLSVLEAMACELPVVASDIGVMREWIEPGVSGVLTQPTAADVAAAMLAVVSSLPVLSQGARRYVESSHERAREMDAAVDLYVRLVAERRTHP